MKLDSSSVGGRNVTQGGCLLGVAGACCVAERAERAERVLPRILQPIVASRKSIIILGLTPISDTGPGSAQLSRGAHGCGSGTRTS